MSDYAVTVEFPAHKCGDHWPVVVGAAPGRVYFGPIKFGEEEAVTPDVPLERMRFKFRHPSGMVYRIDSDAASRDAPLVIEDPANWLVYIDEIANFLPAPGTWSWDAKVYDNGRTSPVTIYKGELVVLPSA